MTTIENDKELEGVKLWIGRFLEAKEHAEVALIALSSEYSRLAEIEDAQEEGERERVGLSVLMDWLNHSLLTREVELKAIESEIENLTSLVGLYLAK